MDQHLDESKGVTLDHNPDSEKGVVQEGIEKVEELKQRMAAGSQEKPKRVVQLDPATILKIELLSTQKQLAASDERNGMMVVQDARRRLAEVSRDEKQLMETVSKQVGVPINSTIRLVDKAQGICHVE